jgi:hypothetical protein
MPKSEFRRIIYFVVFIYCNDLSKIDYLTSFFKYKNKLARFLLYSWQTQKNEVYMNDLLLRVLAVVLSGVSPEPLEKKVVPFEKLPTECVAVYDADIRRFRQVTSTEVISVDLDGDKVNELLIFNGENGSGGEGWTVMQKCNGKYRKTGEVFGLLYKSGKGLIVESPCGWDSAEWNYLELVKGKLIEKFNIDVKYRKSVRQEAFQFYIKVKK